MIIYPYKGKEPEIAESAYIAENAVVTGDVKIGDETSIWFNSVIRGDVSPTIIGKKSVYRITASCTKAQIIH